MQRSRRESILSPSEFEDLQEWLSRLPVVPHLSVLELGANTHPTQREQAQEEDADTDAVSFIELQAPRSARRLKPARVLKGFVDIEREPYTLSQLLNQLPPMPAIVADP